MASSPALPAAPAPRIQLRILARPQTYSVFDIARSFGLFDNRPDMTVKAVCRYIQLQVDRCDFPPPFAHFHGGETIVSVTPRSRFRRDAVDAWFETALPPGPAAALAAAQAREAEAILAERAKGLRFAGRAA